MARSYLTSARSLHESCELISVPDIDIHFVFDEGFHHILVSFLCADMKSSVLVVIPAVNLCAVTDL